METLPLIAPGLCMEVAAYHGGTILRVVSGPGIWDGNTRPLPVSSGDAITWALVSLLAVMLTALALCIRAMRLKPAALTPEQELMEEVQRHETTLANSQPEAPRPPWEREADWWR